jgi:hypothetical protein
MSIIIGGGITIGGGINIDTTGGGGFSGSSRGALSFSRSGQTDLEVLYSSNQSHPPPPARQDTYTGDITIEMWIKPTSNNTDGSLWWFPTGWANNSGVTTYNSFQCIINGSTIRLENLPYTITGGNASAPGTSIFTTISGSINPNTWNYVCVSVVSGIVKLYVNGSLVGHSTASTYTYMPSFFIGRPIDGNNTTAYYDGLITNFRMSNADIYNLASNPATMTVPSAQLTPTSGVSLALMTMSSSATAFNETSGNAGGTTVIEYNPPTWVSTTPF